MESIIDILSQGRDRESQASKIYGLVVGVVSNNQDPDGLGRVKVKFPWLSDDVESWWARPSKPSAGTMIVHNIDDEVLVGFEHGDVRFPYILGALDNGVDLPPKASDVCSSFGGTDYSHDAPDFKDVNEDGDNNIIIFRTPRAGSKKQPCGHIVLFDDTPDKERIIISSADGEQRLEMLCYDTGDDGEPTICITNASGAIEIVGETTVRVLCKDLKVLAHNNIEMEAEKEVKITSGTNMTIESGQNYDLTAKQNITEKADMDFSSEGGMNMNIKGGVGTTVEGGATLDCKSPASTVKGDATLTLMGGVVNIN